ncbi:hemicentin-1-like [Corticium candelabrum]|uniref:hemicentin-1-like n=1 Tax=Corticium candelabrum TaxID=121492 RepID=UPI002E26A7BA|nr:hemicentin-1-like [Corticium candelabrum]
MHSATVNSCVLIVVTCFFFIQMATSAHVVGVIRPAFSVEPESVTVYLGEDALFSCEATGTPTPTYTWLRNGEKLLNSASSTYAVFSITRHDLGVYQCVAENSAGTIISRKSELNVYGLRDTFAVDPLDTPFYVDINTNTPGPGTAVFTCEAGVDKYTYSKSLVISWERVVNGTTNLINTTETPRYVTFQWQRVGILQIMQPQLSDFEGKYRCVATLPELPNDKSISELAQLQKDKDQKFTLTMAPPPELFVGYNKTVVLGCASSGSLNTMFHWTADGSVIADSNGIFPFLPLTEIYEFIKPTNLRIKRATNPTTFKCLFRSDQGLLVAESVVHVIDPPQLLSSSPALVTITEGDSLNLSCAVTGTPRPSIDWLFNGALTLNNQMSRVIPLVGEHHHGMHECFAENDYGTIHSSTFVNVEFPAKASTQPKDQIVLVGQLASISCFARANPSDISYSWEKDGKVLTNSSRVTVLDHVLLIDNVTLEDTGNYTCVPKNSIGTGMTATASLLVAILPSIVHLLDSITVNESDSVSLPCTASGVPEPTISWTPPSTGSIHQDESGALLIASAQANDGGIYTCEAISQVGMAVDTTQLIVQVVPKTSVDSTMYFREGKDATVNCVIISNPEPTVTWHFLNNPASGLIDFIQTSNKNEYISALTIRSISHDEFGSYECKASNILGMDSTTFHLLKQVIPGVPGRLHVLDRSPFVVTLEWESPSDGGTPILRYRVEYSVFGRNEWHQETTIELRHTVRDLEPKTKYEVRISAVNAVGLGPYAVVMTTTFGLVTTRQETTTPFMTDRPTANKQFIKGSSSTEIGIILGVVFALLFLIVVIAFVLVILLRSRQGQYCVEECGTYPNAPFQTPEKPPITDLASSPKRIAMDPLTSTPDGDKSETKIDLSHTADADTSATDSLLLSALKHDTEIRDDVKGAKESLLHEETPPKADATETSNAANEA